MAVVKRGITRARNCSRRIIYIDETLFTRSTIPKAEWTKPKENMSANVKLLSEPCLCLLAGISKERGLEHYQIYERSVNIVRFKDYLTNLRQANGDDAICIYMDNLRVHTSDITKGNMRELKFQWIYSLAYEPDLNPIEYIFSHIKKNFRELRAKKFMGLIQDSHLAMIHQSVNKVKKKDIIACIDHVMKLIY